MNNHSKPKFLIPEWADWLLALLAAAAAWLLLGTASADSGGALLVVVLLLVKVAIIVIVYFAVWFLIRVIAALQRIYQMGLNVYHSEVEPLVKSAKDSGAKLDQLLKQHEIRRDLEAGAQQDLQNIGQAFEVTTDQVVREALDQGDASLFNTMVNLRGNLKALAQMLAGHVKLLESPALGGNHFDQDIATNRQALLGYLAYANDLATQHIPASRVEQIREWAKQAVRDPAFNAQWLASYARGIGLDTSLLDTVVQNTRALDAGQVGELTLQATRLMEDVNRRIPQNAVDARFMQQVQEQKIKFEKIIEKVKWISQAIEDALRRYQDLSVPIAEVCGKLQSKYDLMVEAIVLNQQLAEKEDEATDILVSRTAELELLTEALPQYAAELRAKRDQPEADKDAIDAEINRLNSLMPLLTKALSMLKPMIFTGNNAVGRYLNLSNMVGGRAMVLGLFISVGLHRWESDIVTQLQELNQLAVGLAESNMEQIMNQQAQASSAGYVQAVQDYMAMLNRWTTTVDTLQRIVADTAAAQKILTDGFAQLKSEYGKTSAVVQDAFAKVQASQQQYNLEMERIASQPSGQALDERRARLS